jgi:hypothetical protein
MFFLRLPMESLRGLNPILFSFFQVVGAPIEGRMQPVCSVHASQVSDRHSLSKPYTCLYDPHFCSMSTDDCLNMNNCPVRNSALSAARSVHGPIQTRQLKPEYGHSSPSPCSRVKAVSKLHFRFSIWRFRQGAVFLDVDRQDGP